MRKLSYFILGIILLLVVIFAIIPVFIGSQIKSQLTKEAGIFNQNHSRSQLHIIQYTRHWFSSDATFNLQYRLPMMLGGMTHNPTITLPFKAHIQHGPIVSYRINSEKYRQLARAAIILHNSNMQGQVIISDDWHNNLKARFAVRNFSHKTTDESIIMSNLMGVLNFQHNDHHLNYNIKLGSFDLSKQTRPNTTDQITLRNNHFIGSLKRQHNLWAGTHLTTRQHATLKRNGKIMLDTQQSHTSIQSSVDNKRIDYTVKLGANNIMFAGTQYKNLQLNADLEHIDTRALVSFLHQAQAIYTQGHLTLQNSVAMTDPLLILIEKGMELKLNQFSVELSDNQSITANGTLQFVAAPTSLSVLNMLQYMSLDINLNVPQELLLQELTEYYQDHPPHEQTQLSARQHAEKTIHQWLQRNTIVKHQDQLKLHLTIKDDSVLINGQPLSQSL